MTLLIEMAYLFSVHVPQQPKTSKPLSGSIGIEHIFFPSRALKSKKSK